MKSSFVYKFLLIFYLVCVSKTLQGQIVSNSAHVVISIHLADTLYTHPDASGDQDYSSISSFSFYNNTSKHEMRKRYVNTATSPWREADSVWAGYLSVADLTAISNSEKDNNKEKIANNFSDAGMIKKQPQPLAQLQTVVYLSTVK